MTVVDNAIYVSGRRTSDPSSLDQTFEEMSERHGMAWIGLYRPDEAELREIADEFGLHPLAVEDALNGHQRPKLDRYGDSVFVVLRPARYVDATEEVEFGEVHVFAGPGLRRHRASRRVTRSRPRPSPPRGRTGAARARPDGGAVRHHRRGRRRVRAGRRRPGERHRRDREPALRERPGGGAAHLRAHPRGHRLPAGGRAARADPGATSGRRGVVRRRPRGQARVPRCARPRDPHRRALGELPDRSSRTRCCCTPRS